MFTIFVLIAVLGFGGLGLGLYLGLGNGSFYGLSIGARIRARL